MNDNSLKHDALQHRRCKSCAAWHNPEGQPVGLCVIGPGTAFLTMQMPARNALMRPDAPGMMGPMPAVQSALIPKAPEDGCLQWRARPEALN